ncbi:MAG: hypothetical protein WB689_04870 [Xanthobacteraceae bacterium]
MRKHNRYLPPALKHNGRQNNSVVSRRKRKRPNAQKHGVFAEPLILPGEPLEFEAIHSALIEEWTPSGPSEQSRVFGIADAEWRKLRSRRFAQAKAIANSLTPAHPAFDETAGLISFGCLMCREPETAFAEYASKLLRADAIHYLNQKIPPQNFESIEEWAVAVAKEIKSVLLPATPGFATLEPDNLDPATEARRAAIIKMQLFITTIHMSEFLEHDLDQCSRLDARIARLIKELVEIKTMKQVLRRTSIDDKDE